MQYVYAAMLLHAAGRKIDEASVKKTLESAGIEPNEAKVKALVASLEGVNIDEVVKQAAVPVVTAPAAASAETKKEEVKEEDVEKKAEEAAAGLSSLFG